MKVCFFVAQVIMLERYKACKSCLTIRVVKLFYVIFKLKDDDLFNRARF